MRAFQRAKGASMTRRIASVAVLVGGILLLMNGQAAGQVTGSGTSGTVPVWTGDGTVLTDSRIQDNGSIVTVQLPVQVSGTVSGTGSSGPGIDGNSSGGQGVRGTTSADPPFAGVEGYSASPGGRGVEGGASGPGGYGVLGE